MISRSTARPRVRRGSRRLAGVVLAALVATLAPITGVLPQAAAAAPCDAPANPVACENSRPGNPQSEWMVTSTYGDIAGYGTSGSVQAGDVLPFKVSSPSTSWRIDIFRLGWYGGDGARKMATLTPAVALPQTQPACLSDAGSGLKDCGNWAVSATWAVPADAVSGFYVANVVRQDAPGVNQFPFVVRDDGSHSDLVIQTSDQTWQAYNTYGGNSLYGGSFAGSSDGRAYKVSYNRPYLNSSLTNFQNDELPLLRWVERNGYDVSYLSGLDTSRNPALLRNHRVFVSSGHDEYWNGAQRTGVEQARGAGVNLAFFSGNEVFWKTRLEPSIDGSATAARTLVCYKETKAGAKIDPSPEWTGTWRDPRFSPPSDGGRPEDALTGTLFRVNGTATNTITVPARFAPMRLWRNTDIAALQPGQTASLTPSSLGHEWDEFGDNGLRPPGAVAMSDTSVTFSSGSWILKDYGNTFGTGTARHALALSRDQVSGALVFGAGTIQWAWGLDDLHLFPGPATDVRMQQATVNLLADMSAQPRTLQVGLVAATKSTDATGPATVITAPAAGSSIPSGSAVTVTGTATDSAGQVAGVEVSTDGGSTWTLAQPGANGSFANWSFPWTPTALGSATVSARATDDSANIGTVAASTVTVGAQACPCTIFGAARPSTVDSGDTGVVELGVRVTPTATSTVTGVRFFKSAANTGTHTGSLWTTAGTRLATGTFTGETASGWQTLTFASPVTVTGGTTYVASYQTTTGHYSVDLDYFATSGAGSTAVTAPANTQTAPNGLYTYGGGFPRSGFRASNYWVDVTVVEADTAAPTVTTRSPAPGTTGVAATTAVTASFSEPVDPAGVVFSLAGTGGAPVTSTVAVAGDGLSATLTPASALSDGTTYTASVQASDPAGNTMPAPVTWSFTTAPATSLCPCSLFGPGDAPTGSVNKRKGMEVGTVFRVATAGTITGVRFYKIKGDTGVHTGSIWTTAGVRLGTGTFSGETASGWQTLTLATPVPVAAGKNYVVSFFSPLGRYGTTAGYFGTARTVGPLTSPASTSALGNGRFIASASSAYPNVSGRGASYFADVVFVPSS